MQKGKAVVVIGCVFVLIAMLISGCATTGTYSQSDWIEVTADAIAAPDVALKGKTYVLTSGMQNINDEDLQFKEFARYIKNALSQTGHTEADSEKHADLLIRLAYGIGDPQTTASTYTTAPGYSYPVGYYWYSVPPTTQTVRETTYTRRLVLEAYDLKTPGKLPQLWKTTLTSTGSIGDLREVIPYMIAVAVNAFGVNLVGEERQGRIRYDPAEPLVMRIKK